MCALWTVSVAVRAAWACLRQHRWRSLATLAVCGLGTASVLIAGMLNRAHTEGMQQRLRNLGSGLMVSPNKPPTSPGRPRQRDHFISLDLEDAHTLATQLPQVRRVVAMTMDNVTVRLADRALRVRLIGTTSEYPHIRGFRFAQGRFFTPAEQRQRVMVLGHAVHAELLSQDVLPGGDVCVGKTAYQIVGVLQPQGVNFAGEDEDRQVFIPLETSHRQI